MLCVCASERAGKSINITRDEVSVRRGKKITIHLRVSECLTTEMVGVGNEKVSVKGWMSVSNGGILSCHEFGMF